MLEILLLIPRIRNFISLFLLHSTNYLYKIKTRVSIWKEKKRKERNDIQRSISISSRISAIVYPWIDTTIRRGRYQIRAVARKIADRENTILGGTTYAPRPLPPPSPRSYLGARPCLQGDGEKPFLVNFLKRTSRVIGLIIYGGPHGASNIMA